jgi:SAM-dependent methyltransferase
LSLAVSQKLLDGALPVGAAAEQPAGEWWGADPRYRGYRPTGRAVKLDHRVRQAVALVPGGARRLLDLGAGDAYITSELAAAAGAPLGVSVDVGSPEALAPHRRRVCRVTARLPAPLPFRAGSFDVVVALEVIEHLLDPDLFLDECLRVLAPEGSLILSTPRLDGLLIVISLLMGIQPPGVESSPHRRYGSPVGEQRPSGHVHLFTRRAMADALAAHGLRIEDYREGRFSSSWWQAVLSSRRPGLRDLIVGAGLAAYDVIPFRKDVMVIRAVRRDAVHP